MNADTSLVVHEPSSLPAVHDQCAAIEAWAESCESVPELRDAVNKLSAIDEYLSKTSVEGRGRVADAMRRLEVRIGKLLGPAPSPGRPSAEMSVASDITRNQRHDFRTMAENEDVVEAVIADSSDESPASRRKVMEAIKDREEAPPRLKDRRPPLADGAKRAGWEFRKAVERLERIAADDRFAANKQQVAMHLRGHLSYAVEVCQDLLDQLDHQSQED